MLRGPWSMVCRLAPLAAVVDITMLYSFACCAHVKSIQMCLYEEMSRSVRERIETQANKTITSTCIHIHACLYTCICIYIYMLFTCSCASLSTCLYSCITHFSPPVSCYRPHSPVGLQHPSCSSLPARNARTLGNVPFPADAWHINSGDIGCRIRTSD